MSGTHAALRSATNGASALALKKQMDSKFAKKGAAQGLVSGLTFAVNGVIIGIALSMIPATADASIFIAPLVAATMNDSMSALWLLIYNIYKGRGKEIIRSIKTFPGFMICLAAIMGGPVANGAYLLAIAFSGAAYAMQISAIYPVIGAILARIFLKQKISIRVAAGMSICVVGAILIGYAPPSGDVLPNFYLGLICAGIAAFGWASEGVLSVAGMAMVDPEVAINIRQITSGTVFSLVVLPIIGGYALYAQVLTTPNIMMVIAAAALAGSISFLAWYKANSSIGVAKGMALNSTFSLWGIVFPFFISGLVITTNLVIGAIAVFCGAILVVMNPMELIRKEN